MLGRAELIRTDKMIKSQNVNFFFLKIQRLFDLNGQMIILPFD